MSTAKLMTDRFCEKFFKSLQFVDTREKSALVPSWGSVERTELQVWDTAPLVQAGSDRVLDSEARSSDRLVFSFPAPSWRTSREELTFSRASLVSRMAEKQRRSRQRATISHLHQNRHD